MAGLFLLESLASSCKNIDDMIAVFNRCFETIIGCSYKWESRVLSIAQIGVSLLLMKFKYESKPSPLANLTANHTNNYLINGLPIKQKKKTSNFDKH